MARREEGIPKEAEIQLLSILSVDRQETLNSVISMLNGSLEWTSE